MEPLPRPREEPAPTCRLQRETYHLLARIPVANVRVVLDLQGQPEAPVSLLRGTVGAVLHERNPRLYRLVFDPRPCDPPKVPLFVLRRAGPVRCGLQPLDLILFQAAVDLEGLFRRSFVEAGERGLRRARRPFAVARWERRDLRGLPLPREATDLRLAAAVWPLASLEAPCLLRALSPLRILRNGRLVTHPKLADFVVSVLRRIAALLPSTWEARIRALRKEALLLAEVLPAGRWRGAPAAVTRWSARQGRWLELRGVLGSLDLPEGPGSLGPLLAAGQWLHVGKGTTIGLGWLGVAEPESRRGTGSAGEGAEVL